MNIWIAKLIRCASLLAIALLLTACSNNMDDLHAYMDEVMTRPAEPIDPVPPVKTYTPYDYEGQTGRDPFIRSTNEGSDADDSSSTYTGPRPDLERPREYLERYELDTLGMVGTFAREEDEWALVRDPEGVVHRVAVGNYVGRNHGRVTGVQESEMSLTEFISDGLGGWLIREASIALDSR